MVRCPVLSHESGSVKTHHDIQPLYGHIVYNIVVCPLHESGIDVAERHQSVFCHSCRERHRMSFCNAYVKNSFRHLPHHNVHRTSRRHGRRNSHYPAVCLCQFKQSIAEYFLKQRRHTFGGRLDSDTGLPVKPAGSMPFRSALFGRPVSFSFHGVYMQNLRTVHILYFVHNLYQRQSVMSVYRAEVSYIHSLKDILLLHQQ